MSKKEKYEVILSQAKALVDSGIDDIGNMANLSALLTTHFDHHWIGFYRVLGDKLVLGPFQGPVACTTIAYSKGVCGTAWKEKSTQIVADVHQFPGHIACSPLSNSEIVVPCISDEEVFAVLDIDSTEFNTFDETDAKYLGKLVALL